MKNKINSKKQLVLGSSNYKPDAQKDKKTLRSCFGTFSTGVAIAATTDSKNTHKTLTINSFSSLSLEPPLLLFAIDNKSSTLSAFKKNKFFSINILSKNQIALAKECAKSVGEKKWQNEKHYFGNNGNLIFAESLSYFECKKHKIIKLGDHHLVIGEVVDCKILNKTNPLLYCLGKYHTHTEEIN